MNNLSTINQVFKSTKVQSVYGFFQADYILIAIARSIVKETTWTFETIHVHSHQDKYTKWDNLTPV